MPEFVIVNGKFYLLGDEIQKDYFDIKIEEIRQEMEETKEQCANRLNTLEYTIKSLKSQKQKMFNSVKGKK